MKTGFQMLCENISAETEIEVSFYPDTNAQEPFEDDGNLHVVREDVRAVFDVGNGQSLSPSKQNARAKRILRKLKLQMTDRTTA